jgi:hypothetical protein
MQFVDTADGYNGSLQGFDILDIFGPKPGLPDFPLYMTLKPDKIYQMTTKHPKCP